MKTLITSLMVISTPVALFALPNYEPFSDATGSGGTAYAVGNWVSKSDGGVVGTGQKDATGAQWFHAGAVANNAPVITAGNVGYPGLAGGSTNMVLAGDNGATDLASGRYFHSTMNKGLGNGSGAGSRFYSFVMQASDLSGLGAAGGTAAWIAGFNNSAGVSQTGVPTVIGGRTILKAVGGGYQIGLCKTTDTPTFYTGQTFNVGDTVFVVVEYAMGATSTNDDIVNMWINPSYTNFGNNASKPVATLTAGSSTPDLANGAAASSIQSFLLGNKASLGLYNVDEVRVGADWASVTPALITSQPTNLTKDYGQSAVFSVSTGSSATYLWQKNGSPLGGETASTLTLPSVSQNDEGSYAVAVTGGNGSITSSIVTLTVNDPKLTSGPTPTSQSLPPGATAMFSVTAIGSPTLTYQWKKDGVNVANGVFGGTTISGATSAALTITSVRAGGGGDSGSYTLSVTNGLGRGLTSSGATLAVIDPAVTSDPQSQAKSYNQSVTFNATVAGSSPPFLYAWKKDGASVTVDGVRIVQNNGGTTSSLTINSLTFADQATSPGYTVVVTDNAAHSATSAVATLTVTDPIINAQLVNSITNAGTTAKLKVQAAGSGSVTYVWKTNGVPVSNGATPWGSTISGATSDTLSIASVTPTDANTYVVEVSGAGPMQSNTGTLSVVQITQQPTPLVIATGTRAVFTSGATITGPGTLSYQWRKSSGDISGETGTSLSIASAQPSDSDSYYMRVTYGPGTQFLDTSAASLTVTSATLQLQRTNLVVARVGDGIQTLRDAGNSIYLDQFTTSGTYVNTITIPESGSSAIIARGTAGDTINSLGGMTTLTLSSDGGYLTVNGYQTNYDATATVVLGSGSAGDLLIPRAVTTVDKFGQYSMRIEATPPAIAGNPYRCAAFDGVDEYWGAVGSTTAGVYYFGTEQTAGGISFNNARIVAFFNGIFYVSGANLGIFHFDGKPHPGDALTQDIWFSTTGGSGGCDLAVSPDGNTIYVADGRNWSSTVNTNVGGIQKWEKSGGVFGAIPSRILKPDPGTNTGALYVTADFSQANPVVYAVTIGASQNKLVKIIDDGSNSGAGTATVLATAGPNQEYRGVRFGPSLPPPVLNRSLPGAGTTHVTVSWSSLSGGVYRLEYKNDLAAALWTALSTNTATNTTTSYIDTSSPPPAKRFYRVVAP